MAVSIQWILAEHDGFQPVADDTSRLTYDLERNELVLIEPLAGVVTGVPNQLMMVGVGI